MAESGRTDDFMVAVPRTLLRDVATYLYNHGEDMLRMALEECDDDDAATPGNTDPEETS